MQTKFSPEQLETPSIAEANSILRKCVHCGFCLSACPTYKLTGDENDSPRGRIYLLKDMFESGSVPEPLSMHHIDRCLGCLGCMPACPSGVDYMRLADLGRQHIEARGRRRLADRIVRRAIAGIVSREALFRRLLTIGRSIARFGPGLSGPGLSGPGLSGPGLLGPGPLGPFKAMIGVARRVSRIPPRSPLPARTGARGPLRKRILLMPGCAQQVLHPEVNAAAIRVLARHGAEVVVAPASGCCGAISYHMGHSDAAQGHARRNLAAWDKAAKDGAIDAIVNLASGCGLLLKDYGRFFSPDQPEARAAAAFAASVRDISEVLAELGIAPVANGPHATIAYQAPCSLEHGQRIRNQPRDLLVKAGFALREIAEPHLCCGSAGAYSLLQPDMSTRLKARKVAAIRGAGADMVATANIGCQIHLEDDAGMPVVHLVELLDWATGGPQPAGLERKPAAK
ncbi:MAG: heterodisulfide reductase-related iron-sulfur binding cluster [Alphaproteobacteria bacterium]